MSHIAVCPLAHVGAVLQSSGARSVVSLLSPGTRPPNLPADVGRRLHLTLSDITDVRAGHILAGCAEMNELLGFVGAWDRSFPLLIHCYAGVSRSTAAAFIALCMIDPARSETAHALVLRHASPTATPNRRLVALADAALQRRGRMVQAVEAIGRGAECFEGNVFSMPVPFAPVDAPRVEMG